ncbi:MAG TPA: hypothetical protein PL106_00265 [Flavobacteriales bacterium]|nr:hypothetical protein [Flavobacteriales bacterium]
MPSDYNLLIEKLDAFIRKYYKDRLIRGALYSVGLLVLFFLGASLSEYFGRFGTTARTVLFWGFLLVAAGVLARFIILPLVKLFHLGKVISHDEAAAIVGQHFGEVKDKLLNTLQLREQANSNFVNRELIEASIAQRSRELSPVPFAAAIDLGKNRKYLRYALPPLAVLLVLLFAAPSLITDPANRIIKHTSEFAPPAPFRFVVLDSNNLNVPEQEDFDLRVAIVDGAVPQQVELDINGQRIPLVKQDASHFIHRFRNVQEAVHFKLTADGFFSKPYTLETVSNPMLTGLAVRMEYPPYLGMPPATANGGGDVTVPAGTRITWAANTRSTDELELAFDDTTYTLVPQGENAFTASRRFLQGHTYTIVPRSHSPGGGERTAKDPLQYRVDVVPDLYPPILIEQKTDSTSPKRLYFKGDIGDDHGFKRLVFHYGFSQGGDSTAAELRERDQTIGIDPKNTRQQFFHFWDLNDLRLLPGDKLEYWFEVWDNDGVHGSKSARTATQVFEAPTLKELADKQNADNEAVKSELKESIKEAQELQRELDKLRRDMLDKKDLNWQDKQKLENVMEKQKQLQQRIEKTTEQFKQNNQEQQSFRDMDERLLQKQQQVQELFENVLSEEMKKLYEEVQKLMEQMDKEDIQEKMEEMKMSQEDIEKELDRAMEQFKRMEVEQKAEDIAEQLEKLAEEQKKLAEETRNEKGDNSEQQKKQEELNKAFDDIRKQLDDLEKKNSELETPVELPKTDQQEQDIQKEQEGSQQDMQQKQNQKAGDKQQKAGEQMEQMAFQMKSAMGANEQQQQEEDMDALRQLLENIVQLSFDQEAALADLNRTAAKDPHLVDIGRQQKKMRDDARVVEDSLFALSKRVPQLQAAVNREMNAVNENMDQAMEHLATSRADLRGKPQAADKQQRAMTGLNNLALLLDEALQQMQQPPSGMPGSGKCNKPGGKGSSSGNSKKMAQTRANQQALSKQLEEMKKALEKGGKKPGDKPGEQPGKDGKPGGLGMPGMSQQLAQLAAQQAAIRKEMQRAAQELNKDGTGAGQPLQKLAEEMEKLEKDIVNKNITQESLKRQQDIMVRLLEAEKSERERELDNKRESNEGRETPHADPARFFEYQRTKQREAELLRTVPPGLKPYYKARVAEYFDTFDRPR